MGCMGGRGARQGSGDSSSSSGTQVLSLHHLPPASVAVGSANSNNSHHRLPGASHPLGLLHPQQAASTFHPNLPFHTPPKGTKAPAAGTFVLPQTPL